jgi:exonuclease SbcC
VLQVDQDGRMWALDNEQEAVFGPETLSGGTRMQLLMALRLAWTSVLEKDGEPLPIFLDEALATADPERFDSIARNLRDTVASDRRQVLYLSADAADLDRWQRATGTRPHHIDLPQLRFGRPSVASDRAGAAAQAAGEAVPEPGDLSAEDYASRLGVADIRRGDGAGSVHVYFLLSDDLPLLYRLRRDWGVSRLGPLERLLESDAAVCAIPDAGQRDWLRGRIGAVRMWVELWRQGRGRSVDRSALEASGVVSPTFLDPVTALADQLGGDAEALLQALGNGEVARFRRAKLDALRDWLGEHDYLGRHRALSRQEREQEVLRRASGGIGADEIRQIIAVLERSASRAEATGDDGRTSGAT